MSFGYNKCGVFVAHGMNCPHLADKDEACTCAATERTMHAAWRKRAEEAENRIVELSLALAVMADELADFHRAESKYINAKRYFSDAVFEGGSLWLCAQTQANAIAAVQLKLAGERWKRGAPPHQTENNGQAECAMCRGADDVARSGPDNLPRCRKCRA